MYFLDGDHYLLGGALFVIGNVMFGASIVVYNSFLPEIAAPEERDAVSARGWGIGYLGGGLLLALNLVLYLNAAKLGISEGMAVRISLCSAGIWWAVFTIPPLLSLQNRGQAHSLQAMSAISASFRQLGGTISHIRRYPQTLLFLAAFLLYNDAIQAVLAMASQFGNDELKVPVSQLTLMMLMVQFVAFAGAMFFNWLSSKLGTRLAIAGGLMAWIAVLLYIYASVQTTVQLFIAAAVVGLVMGGTQALSRSLFAQLIPKGREGEIGRAHV